MCRCECTQFSANILSLTKTYISISDELPNEQIHLSRYGHPQINSLEALKPFQCPSCPSTFYEKCELKAHISASHGDQMPFCCQLCGKGYLSRRGLNHHILLHKGQVFSCPICSQKTNRKDNMNAHLRRMHKSEQCSKCMQVFPLAEFHLHIAACLQ